jgi:PKD repeat protein
VLAPDAKVWSNPTTDQAYPLRRNACPEFSPTPPQCLTAAVGHPDVAGSAQYAANILLNPRLRSWFGLPAGLPVAKATVTVSTTAGTPGTEVSLRTTARAGAGTRYQWYFGDGTTQTTDTAATTHRYDAVGPSLPRVVTVDGDGDRDLREARRPVVIG